MDDLEFVPIKLLPAHIAKGWQMVPGYMPAKNDYACLMTRPVRLASNLSRAASIRNLERQREERA